MKNEKGITLIALIITIIVMLILVGVTINVALNGGLFSKAKQGSFQTEASMVKEQLEIAKAVAIADNGGNPLDDYSIITIDKTDLDDKTKNKYIGKIIVNSNGDICYDSSKITDAQEQDWLKAIGIKENTKPTEKESYTITLAKIVSDNISETNDSFMVSIEDFWDESVSEELRNYTTTIENCPINDFNGFVYYNFVCNKHEYTNYIEASVSTNLSDPPCSFLFWPEDNKIIIMMTNEHQEYININNYAPYADFEFTITLP